MALSSFLFQPAGNRAGILAPAIGDPALIGQCYGMGIRCSHWYLHRRDALPCSRAAEEMKIVDSELGSKPLGLRGDDRWRAVDFRVGPSDCVCGRSRRFGLWHLALIPIISQPSSSSYRASCAEQRIAGIETGTATNRVDCRLYIGVRSAFVSEFIGLGYSWAHFLRA